MFENIIGQDRIVDQLRREIAAGTLPSSLLFYGEPFTAKTTTALELGRILLCEKGDARWECDCVSCTQNRLLIHPSLIMGGPSSFLDEIYACGSILGRQSRPAAAYLFIRALRKLIRRFDPEVWECSESKRRRVDELIETIEENITLFSPGNPRPPEKELNRGVKTCVEKAVMLAKEYPQDTIPINSIRKIVSWVHTTSASRSKVIVIENAERMGDASRNALLKILEEPPKGVYFILITTRKGLIIPTIISRLRQYYFPKRDIAVENKILSSIFREESGEYPDLKAYFLAWRNIPVEELHESAKQYLKLLFEEPEKYGETVPQIAEKIADKEHAKVFLTALQDELHKKLHQEESERIRLAEMKVFEAWGGQIQDCMLGIEMYNQKPSLRIQDLFYTMRSTV